MLETTIQLYITLRSKDFLTDSSKKILLFDVVLELGTFLLEYAK